MWATVSPTKVVVATTCSRPLLEDDPPAEQAARSAIRSIVKIGRSVFFITVSTVLIENDFHYQLFYAHLQDCQGQMSRPVGAFAIC
jgi:hypothetical protein